MPNQPVSMAEILTLVVLTCGPSALVLWYTFGEPAFEFAGFVLDVVWHTILGLD